MTRTNRMILVLVAAAAAVGAYWFLLLSPKREEVTRLDADIAATQQAIETSKGEIAVYEKARGNYKRNYTTVARLGKAVPADDDVRSLLVQVDTAAKSSKASFDTIDLSAGAASGATATPTGAGSGRIIPGATVGTAGFATMPFNLTFQGDFFELSSVFTDLERFVKGRGSRLDVTGRLVLVKSFTLQPEGEDWQDLSATVTATSYLLPESEGLLAGATPTGPAGTASAPGQPAPATTTPAPATTTPAPATTAAISGVTR